MLIAYGSFYAPHEKKADLKEMGMYNVLFYFTHVITIIIVANIMFVLKAVDKRFKDDDVSFDDIPSLQAHRANLRAKGIDPDDKSIIGMLTPHLLLEKLKEGVDKAKEMKFSDVTKGVQHMAEELRNKTQTAAHILSAGIIPDTERQEVHHHWAQVPVDEERPAEYGDEESFNPLQGVREASRPSAILGASTAKLVVGDRVTDSSGNCATVSYVGPISNPKAKSPDSVWIGVAWDIKGRGRHDGSCKDSTGQLQRYFSCDEGMGSFLPEHMLWLMTTESTKPVTT
jgi:CAP-Gly domain